MYYEPNLSYDEIKDLEKVRNFSQIDPSSTILSYGGYNTYSEAGFKGTVSSRSFSPQQTIKMIRAGRNDLGFEVLGVTPYFVKIDNPQDLSNWGFVDSWTFVPQYMAFNGSYSKGKYYEEKFKEGIETIKNNGVYLDIYEKFYGKNNVPKSAVAVYDNQEIKEFSSKIVDDDKFDMNKFLRQKRDNTGFIVEFVD
jgi:hypothetical protein